MIFLERYNISPILFAFIVLLITFITYQLIGSLIALLFFGISINQQNVNGFRLFTAFSQIFFLLIPTILFTKLVSTNIWEYLRYRKISILQIIIIFFGIFSLQQLLQIYLIIQDMIPVPEGLRNFLEQMRRMVEESYRLIASSSNIPELAFVIFVVALIPAFAEETLFRGLIQKCFEKSLNPVKAIALTGVIFGFFHLNPITLIPLSIIGFYLGFLAYKAKSIMAPISAHFFNNLLAAIAFHLNYGDDEIIIGKPSDIPIEMLIIIIIIFFMVFVLSMYYFIRVSKIINSKTTTEVSNAIL